MTTYQGWTNSATHFAMLYIQQERVLHERIVALFKAGKLDGAAMKALAPVRVNTNEDDSCGYVGGIIRLDTDVEGEINWQEIADTFCEELGH